MAQEMIETNEPVAQDPQLASLVAKVTAALKLEVMSALAREAPGPKLKALTLKQGTPSHRVHQATNGYFNRLTAEHKRVLATRLVSQAATRDVLGESKLVSPLSIKVEAPILEQLDVRAEYAFLDDVRKLNSLVRAKIMMPRGLNLAASTLAGLVPDALIPERAAPAAARAAAPTGTLSFRVHDVKCLDESDWEWGSDEISMGGVTTDAAGKVEKIKEFKVKSGFNANETKKYAPPNVLKSFVLNGSDYPKVYAVTLTLAEKDSAGFATFIQELYEATKEHINQIMVALGAAAGAAIGAAAGGAVGTIGGPLGALIGVAAGLVIGALVGWISSALQDEVFTPKMAVIGIPEAGSLFGESAASSLKSFNYYDHGAHYRVRYSWAVEW